MKILSEGKFRKFDGFKDMGEKEVIDLVFDGTEITCTKDHKFLRSDKEWIEAQDIKVGETYDGYVFKHSIDRNSTQRVYDAINVRGTHSFYAEGVTAHNCNLLYIDELAFVKDWEDFSQSVLPTLSAGVTTKMVFSSTPNGLNHFYYYVKGAREKKNDFQLVEVPWNRVPGRGEEWKRKALADLNGDQLKFAQEYCVTGDTRITIKDKNSGEIMKVNMEELRFLLEFQP